MIEDLWYKNAVIYALNVDSFMDGNGDGCGDFEGLTRRLNYLESLGVDAVWIGPLQTSPNKDNGYDISDFYSLELPARLHGSGVRRQPSALQLLGAAKGGGPSRPRARGHSVAAGWET